MLRAKNNSVDFLFKALSFPGQVKSLSLSLSLSLALFKKNKKKRKEKKRKEKEKENLGYLVYVDSITF